MNVLSLFDGISCGQVALQRAGVKLDNYFASEVDKHAIQCTQYNFPNTIQLGDVCNINYTKLPKIDLLIGGSPCQGLSRAGKRLGLNDPRSKLFFEFIKAMKTLSPKHVFFENVDSNFNDELTRAIGIRPITINSNRFSAQNRKRLYWTSLDIDIPISEGPHLRNVIQYGTTNITNEFNVDWDIKDKINPPFDSGCTVYEKPHGFNNGGLKRLHKFPTLRSATPYNYAILDFGVWRRITPEECELLQTLPKGYTSCIGKTQRYKALGNCWTVDVVTGFFKNYEQN